MHNKRNLLLFINKSFIFCTSFLTNNNDVSTIIYYDIAQKIKY